MHAFFLTLIIAFIIVLLCFACMGIGKILTGKSKFSCKRCGKPEDKSCDICHKDPKKK